MSTKIKQKTINLFYLTYNIIFLWRHQPNSNICLGLARRKENYSQQITIYLRVPLVLYKTNEATSETIPMARWIRRQQNCQGTRWVWSMEMGKVNGEEGFLFIWRFQSVSEHFFLNFFFQHFKHSFISFFHFNDHVT